MTSYIWYIQADLKKPSANGRGNLMLKWEIHDWM
jgi:hypothetical protein